MCCFRDVYKSPVNNSKAGEFLIKRSSPVTMPTTQRTSPNLKIKRHYHGNHITSWHNNHSMPQTTLRSSKSNWWRRDENSSRHNPNHNKLDSTANNDSSNNSTPLLSDGGTNSSGRLSVDTKLCSHDPPIQTISSPHSSEVIQTATEERNDEAVSCPVIYTRSHQTDGGYDTLDSYSDSVTFPLSGQYYFNEPLHIVPKNSKNLMGLTDKLTTDSAGKSSLLSTSQDSTNYTNVSRKWPSTELFHDSDNEFSDNSVNNDQNDQSFAIGQTIDDKSGVNNQTNHQNSVFDQTNDQSCIADQKNQSCIADQENNHSCVIDQTDDQNSVKDINIVTERNEQVVDDNSPDTSNSDITESAEITDNDVDFLKSCFPNIPADQVAKTYTDCEHDIEVAVGELLLFPMSHTVRLVDFTNLHEYGGVIIQEESSSQTTDDDNKEVMLTKDAQTSTDEDEKIARALQEQWDKEFMEEKSSGLMTNKSLQDHNDPSADDPDVVQQTPEDEGLILRLPPPLASKLQDMFGSVKEHLITDGKLLMTSLKSHDHCCCSGEPTGDDLVVLLSERAAKEIYKKWLDTLQVCYHL